MTANFSSRIATLVEGLRVEGLRQEASASSSLASLREAVDGGNFVSFSGVAKIGINPAAEDNFNPKGFYGIPLTDQLLYQLQQLAYRQSLSFEYFFGRRFIYVFRPRGGLNLLELDTRQKWSDFKERYGLEEANGSQLALAIMKLGYEGIISTNNGMSGDFREEICLFPPYSRTVEVTNLVVNRLEEEFILDKLENDLSSVPKADRPRVQQQLKLRKEKASRDRRSGR